MHKDEIKEILEEYFNVGNSYTYTLKRNKSAFEIGTMTLDDFEEISDEEVTEIACLISERIAQKYS